MLKALYFLLAYLVAFAACGADPNQIKPAGFSDIQLEQIRAGFDSRRDDMLNSLKGKPFVEAAKAAPISPGRPPYVRAYTYSVTNFAMRVMWLNEPNQIETANSALQKMCRYFIDNPAVRDDYDNFYWSADVVCRLVEFFGHNGSIAKGRLYPKTEDSVLEMMWLWSKQHSLISDAEYEKSRTWRLTGTENHHLQQFSTAWQFAKFLNGDPRYSARKYDDGKTAGEHYAAWTAYAKEYFRQRAKKGFLVEYANSNYGSIAMKGVYNFYDFADDPLLKKRAGYMLDLFWATWAQEQLDGVRGGGRARIYHGVNNTRGQDNLVRLAWYYLGIGKALPPVENDYSMLTSTYRMPLVVMDIALDVSGRGVYEVKQWPLGRTSEGEHSHSSPFHIRTDISGIYRYSYCTPDFIIGTAMVEARSSEDWIAISSQNRWQGIIFAGDRDARLFPESKVIRRSTVNDQWSVQLKGTLITQKLKSGSGGTDMRVWFADAGLTNRVEKDGWVFVEAKGAFAAVRPVAGGFDWRPDDKNKDGRWLTCRDQWTPIIFEVARKTDYRDYASFQSRILARTVKFENQILEYKGIYGDTLTFFADYSKPPKINGVPVNYDHVKAFDSPFVKGDWDSGVITIQKAARKLTLDFNSQ